MESHDTFPLFSRLPAELRLRVWEFNLPVSRVVPIRCGSDLPSVPPPTIAPLCTGHEADTSSAEGHGQGRVVFSVNSRQPDCSSLAPIPANLHTCAESRAQALRQYSLSFSFARQPAHIFFSPPTDILYFAPRSGYMAANAQFHTAMSLIRPADLANVRRIAIDDALFRPFSFMPPEKTHFNNMSSLAGHCTVGCLRQLHRRMPNLEEIIFSPRSATRDEDPILILENLRLQVQTAVRDYAVELASSGHEPWIMPVWRILNSPLFELGLDATLPPLLS